MDEDGLRPDALDRACADTSARLLFVMPTLQNPTGATMPASRRAAIAGVARRRGLLVLEDDVYGFLAPAKPRPLATLLPEQSFYVGSFSKSLAPGLRSGFVIGPRSRVEELAVGVRATAWMASPLMAEIVARWVEDGTAIEIAEAKRGEAHRRCEIAAEVLGSEHLAPVRSGPCFHAWLRLAGSAAAFAAAAAARGVAVTPSDAVETDASAPSGVRLCLGAPGDEARLRRGLGVLAALLRDEAQMPSIV